MAKRKDKPWALDPSEVSWGTNGITIGRRKQATKASRADTVTGTTLFLHHHPTGIQVAGEIPPGNYTKTQMQENKRKLYQQLFPQLEKLVAKQLGVPGR
ncbi:hypothetical protein CAI21_09360 [Alkalilimnicola ehrlichii]|uniref:Uncharacterized protein n=1 Tax=Alkalilimnicola ehrlichii TaxID=351052 RepID=A0A3E0WUZ4_9GAMM|nr:hypothetical protein [Alkalilimnicola ehrlichii]RFA29283.1 hypothetical protein CAI21_09360 [Alkalilimnicola ehrlichii]RFA36800.1 hypothetical protein CAL65_09705 [Alkalilimnicola ehrlichii]